jgi:hypothetical protein
MIDKTSEVYKRGLAQRREKYRQRKADGKCTSCGCKLLPEWRRLCPECKARLDAAGAAYERSPKGQARKLVAVRAWRARQAGVLAAARRDEYATHRRLGLCVRCDADATNGVHCTAHLEVSRRSSRASLRKKRRQFRKERRCMRCGGERAKGRRQCERCLEDGRKRIAEKRLANRAAYQRRKEAGLCVRCEAGLDNLGGWACLLCPECRDERRARDRVYQASERGKKKARDNARIRYTSDLDRSRAKVREIRLAKKLSGTCHECSQPALDDNGMCELHREKARARSRKSWASKPKIARAA